MKKIVYVVGGLVTINGMSTILSAKINYLAQNTDYDIYMILTEKPNHPWCYHINPNVKWVNFGIEFDELDTMPLYKKIIHYYIKQRKYKHLLSNYLMGIRPDITISALRREINFINDIHDGSKKIGELHFERSFYRNFNRSFLPSFVNLFISNRWMKSLIKQINRLDRFVVLTHEDYNNWPELENKVVIPNFVQEYKGEKAPLVSKSVIAVGRYTWQKGFDLLINAWKDVAKIHPDWILNIYGSGEQSYYLNLINSLNLTKQIICHGPTSNIYEIFVENSFFVLSSRYEGFGLVIVEAMSVGLPVVSFSCPCGPSDIIFNNSDGILVKKNNIDDLSKAICYMIEHPQERNKMGERAIEKAKLFYPNHIMKQWIHLFESI